MCGVGRAGMTRRKVYALTTPDKVLDCLHAGMSIRRAAEVLGVSKSTLGQACTLFGWRAHGWAGPKLNTRELPARPVQGAHDPFVLAGTPGRGSDGTH